MKHSKIYKKAAESIYNGDQLLACEAIKHIAKFPIGKNVFELLENFTELFKSDNLVSGRYVWFGPAIIKENQLARQLALLLMSEIYSRDEKLLTNS